MDTVNFQHQQTHTQHTETIIYNVTIWEYPLIHFAQFFYIKIFHNYFGNVYKVNVLENIFSKIMVQIECPCNVHECPWHLLPLTSVHFFSRLFLIPVK